MSHHKVLITGIVCLYVAWFTLTTATAPAHGQSSVVNLLLTQALDTALLQSPRAASARAILPVARSGYAKALTFPNPVFQYIQNFKADQVQQIGAFVPVEPPWKVIFRLFATKQEVTQADRQVIADLWLLRADVRRAYVDAVIAQELEELQTKLTSIFEKFVVIGEERNRVGDVSLLEVEKARLARDQALIQKNRQIQLVLYAKQRLNIIMGRNIDESLIVPRLVDAAKFADKDQLLPALEKEPPALAELIVQAMEAKPQLRVLKKAIAANKAQTANAIASISPNADLTFGRLVAKDIGSGPNITHGFVAGVFVEAPVLNFQQGELARLKAVRKQLYAELATQQNITTDQVAAAYRQVMIARQMIRAYQEAVLARSAKVVEMTTESYQYGQSDITAALVAAQLNIQTQTDYLNAVSNYQQALTNLEQAVGVPLQ